MKKNDEIFSLNLMKFELKETLSLDERLERLSSNELKSVKAGNANCPQMDSCALMDCPSNCTNYNDCFVYNPCELNCEGLDCPYDDGLGCYYGNDCYIMT